MKKEFANFLRRWAESISPMEKEDYMQLDGYKLQEARFSVLVGAGKISHCQRYDTNAENTLRHEAEYQVNQRLVKMLQNEGGIHYDYREDTGGIMVTGIARFASKKITDKY